MNNQPNLGAVARDAGRAEAQLAEIEIAESAAVKAELPAPAEETVAGVKGFDKDFRCRGFQFQIGETYEHDGPVVICDSGFHAVAGHPLEVFAYYGPAVARYAETTQSGALARSTADDKIASARITIVAEIHLHDLVQRAVEWVFARVEPEANADKARGATGERGAASATGRQGAASATGFHGRAMGAQGCALFLVFRNPGDGKILHAWAGLVGSGGIEPGVFYTLDAKGTPQKAGP